MKATAVIRKADPVSADVNRPSGMSATIAKMGGAAVEVDPALDPTSSNPVENKAIVEALALKADLEDIPTVPSKVSAFTNDAGYITGINSGDVTTALGFTPYNATNPSGFVNASGAASAAPVQSVNGQTGAVTLSIPTVPSNVSAFANDAGYVNASGAASASPVQSVNGQTGAVSLTIPTVPTAVSAFNNDAGYLTLSTLPIYQGGVSP